MARARRIWLGRSVLAGALVLLAFAPGQASGSPAAGCTRPRCRLAGTVLWARELPGPWLAESDALGTVPAGATTAGGGTAGGATAAGGTAAGGTAAGATAGAPGQVYAAAGPAVAAIGYGMTVRAYAVRGGRPLWTTSLSGFPSGSAIMSVRVWPGVVAAGVARPSGAGAAAGSRSTVELAADGGRQLRAFPAAVFGGTITADPATAVVIGPAAVTSYDLGTGRVRWTRDTGAAEQGWQQAGGYLYVAQAAVGGPAGGVAGGVAGGRPATTLRRISLRTGAQQAVRRQAGSFAGRLGAALDGVVLFSAASGVTAYRADTGRMLWRRPGTVPESVDLVRRLFYLSTGGTLIGVRPGTGRTVARITGANGSGSAGISGIYGVRDGVALGLDQGALGQAWGYDVGGQQVIWTTKTLPWPHYFVDLSGIGGSADPGSGSVLLTTCAQRAVVGARQVCQRPELVLVGR